MTCKQCGIQYVGETGDLFSSRMNSHRSRMKCNKHHHLVYRHSHYSGYRNQTISHCVMSDFDIQPIEMLKEKTTDW